MKWPIIIGVDTVIFFTIKSKNKNLPRIIYYCYQLLLGMNRVGKAIKTISRAYCNSYEIIVYTKNDIQYVKSNANSFGSQEKEI